MLKIAICDDDVKMTGRLDTVLEEIAKRNFVKIDTEVFLDGGELEKAVEEKMYFDIIFLDRYRNGRRGRDHSRTEDPRN